MATIKINRAPVLTLWGAVVAEKLGQDPQAALTFGKCLAGLNAQAKGRMIGIFGEPKEPKEAGTKPKKVGLGEEFWFEVCGRPLPAKNTDDGVRAVVKDKPIDPAKVQAYLERAFGGADVPYVVGKIDLCQTARGIRAGRRSGVVSSVSGIERSA